MKEKELRKKLGIPEGVDLQCYPMNEANDNDTMSDELARLATRNRELEKLVNAGEKMVRADYDYLNCDNFEEGLKKAGYLNDR